MFVAWTISAALNDDAWLSVAYGQRQWYGKYGGPLALKSGHKIHSNVGSIVGTISSQK